VLVKLPIRLETSTNSPAYLRATQSDPPRSAARDRAIFNGKGHSL